MVGTGYPHRSPHNSTIYCGGLFKNVNYQQITGFNDQYYDPQEIEVYRVTFK